MFGCKVPAADAISVTSSALPFSKPHYKRTMRMQPARFQQPDIRERLLPAESVVLARQEEAFEGSVMISGCPPKAAARKRRGAITSISAAGDARRIRRTPSEAIEPEAYHIHWQHRDPRIHDEVERRKDHHGSRHERVVGRDRQWEGERREAEVESGSCCDGNSNHHGEGSGDGNRHDEGCSRGTEVGRGRSIRQTVDIRRLDEMMGVSESGSGHCGESRLVSIDALSRGADWRFERKRTSAKQRTLAPLKS